MNARSRVDQSRTYTSIYAAVDAHTANHTNMPPCVVPLAMAHQIRNNRPTTPPSARTHAHVHVHTSARNPHIKHTRCVRASAVRACVCFCIYRGDYSAAARSSTFVEPDVMARRARTPSVSCARERAIQCVCLCVCVCVLRASD